MITAKAVWKVDPDVAFQKLADKIKNKCIRIALNAGAAPMKAAVIAHAPSDGGFLKKSIKIKIKNYRNANYWVAIIGASSKFKRFKRGVKVRGKKRSVKVVRPAFYQPLVNKGTKHVKGQHFMEDALRSAQTAFATNVKRKLKEIIPQFTR